MPNDRALRLLVNPPDLEAEIGVDFLARCYDGRWNPATYHWYLKREFHGEAPDRLVLAEDQQVLSTAGIVYRQLRTPDDTIYRVGIMVAACVPPRERGRGRFSRLWKGAVNYCAARDCTALLGFVTADNASCLILRRARAVQIPSSYVISDDPPTESTVAVPHVTEVAYGAWRDHADSALQYQCSAALAGFHYPDVNAWRAQFIDRPHPVELLRVGDTSRAIIERVGETDRLQWLDADPEYQGAARPPAILHVFDDSASRIPSARLRAESPSGFHDGDANAGRARTCCARLGHLAVAGSIGGSAVTAGKPLPSGAHTATYRRAMTACMEVWPTAKSNQ